MKREEFAVSLRKEKKSIEIQSKRYRAISELSKVKFFQYIKIEQFNQKPDHQITLELLQNLNKSIAYDFDNQMAFFQPHEVVSILKEIL